MTPEEARAELETRCPMCGRHLVDLPVLVCGVCGAKLCTTCQHRYCSR